MKLIHLGDLHLGKSLGEYDLAEDQRYILNQILDIIKRESADAVLIAEMCMTKQCRVNQQRGF